MWQASICYTYIEYSKHQLNSIIDTPIIRIMILLLDSA